MSIENFDWSLYEDGYTGGSKLVINKSIKTGGKKVKIYSHAPYAQELYDKYEGSLNGVSVTSKDSIAGNIYNIKSIVPVSANEVRIDSDNGMSAIVDMNKERQYVESLGYSNVSSFMTELRKHAIPLEGLTAKVVGKRVSIWDGAKSKIEAEFMQEYTNGPRYAYPAKIISYTTAGFIANVMGVECFMPKSLASSGPITDPESYIGRTLNVCIVNYSQQTSNFVISYKKYMEMVLPSKIENELYIGKQVRTLVTGLSKNGIFCSFRDDEGEYIFTSLLHRSTMSKDMETSFDAHEYVKGDMFVAYIHKINVDENGNYRIVIGDKRPEIKDEEEDVEEKIEL